MNIIKKFRDAFIIDRQVGNVISNKAELSLNIFFFIYMILCIAPLILVFMISITEEIAIARNGYSFFPTQITWDAYKLIFKDYITVGRAYGISIFVTVTGTLVGMIITALYAFPISRKDFRYRNFFSFFVFFCMLFSAGLVPKYILYVRYLHLKNNLIAIILPLLVIPFHILIVRTFFRNSIPDSIIESAKLDGASEFKIFFRIVIPLSKPVLATISLFSTLYYWNDWFNSMLFITNDKLVNLPYMMQKVVSDVEWLMSNSDKASHLGTELAMMPNESMRMAMAIVGIGPIIFAYPFFQKYFVEGLTIGAIKG